MLQDDPLVSRIRRNSIIRHSGVRSATLSCLLRRAATEGSYAAAANSHLSKPEREASVADTLGLALDASEAPMDPSSVLVHEYVNDPLRSSHL